MEAEIQATQDYLAEGFLLKQCEEKPEILNLNEIYKSDQPSQCSYCHKSNSNYTWSFTKKQLMPYTYQLMIQRGWRRCGTYYYKPNLHKCCCKLYTHRLDVTKFRIKKDQKKAIKKVITIAYECLEPMQVQKNDKQKEKEKPKPVEEIKYKIQNKISENFKTYLQNICHQINISVKNNLGKTIELQNLSQQNQKKFNFDISSKIKFFTSKPGEKSDYYSNYVMLLFGLNKKLFSNPKYTLINFTKDFKPVIELSNKSTDYKLQVERGGYLLFSILNEDLKKQMNAQFQVIQLLKQNSSKMCQEKSKNQGVFFNLLKGIKSSFNSQEEPIKQVKLEDKHSSNFQILKPQYIYKGQINISYNKITFGNMIIDIVKAEQSIQSFNLYREYTKEIHSQQQKKMSSYVNFLCLKALNYQQKPLKNVQTLKDRLYTPSFDYKQKYQKSKVVEGQVKKLMGCYHMKYYLKGKLIAVGVIDIVPSGLSSVYFFYDPKYKENRLGVFSSIIEIEYIRYMQLSFPEFKNYYMGFYISTTNKMNYKIDYSPCQLLCPQTYRFVDYTDHIKQKIEKIVKGQIKNPRLSQVEEIMITDMNFGKELGPFIDKNIKLLYNGQKLILKNINPAFFVHILKILNVNVPVWGKKIFQIFTLTV